MFGVFFSLVFMANLETFSPHSHLVIKSKKTTTKNKLISFTILQGSSCIVFMVQNLVAIV